MRGTFVRRIDVVLGPQVAEFVQDKRPVQPIAFETMTRCEMRKQPMDLDYFVGLCRTLVSSMSKDI